MDVRIQAALIAAICTLIGVIFGGFIQVYLKDREISREKAVAEGAVCIYLCNLRYFFSEFSEDMKIFQSLALGISVNDNNIQEINKVIELIERHDAFLVIKLFNIRQRLSNIRIYVTNYYKQRDAGKQFEKLQEVVGYMKIDAEGGLTDIDETIKHAFNHAEPQTKSYLLKNSDFKSFLEAALGAKTFKYNMIKLGMYKKI